MVATVPVVLSSRTYTTRSGGGTYGLGVAAVPPEEMITGVLRGLKDHLGGKPLKDEVSIIVVKMKGE